MYYIIITQSVYADKELNNGAKLLYGLILSLSQKDGYCYADNEYLSDTLNISKRMVGYHLQALTEKHYIYIKQHKNGVRMITTQDTRVKLTPSNKTPLETKNRSNRQIAQEPEWLQGYIDSLRDYQG